MSNSFWPANLSPKGLTIEMRNEVMLREEIRQMSERISNLEKKK